MTERHLCYKIGLAHPSFNRDVPERRRRLVGAENEAGDYEPRAKETLAKAEEMAGRAVTGDLWQKVKVDAETIEVRLDIMLCM